MELQFDYPLYCIIFCLLAGGLYSALLYWRDRRLADPSLPVFFRRMLPLLRFLTVSGIAFLLMAPAVRRNGSLQEKPIILIAQDCSESVPDSHRQCLMAQVDRLRGDYQVVVDLFGGKSTDIAAALADVRTRYAGRNLGAVVLASDGIYNQGQNPSLVAPSLAVPVYTVALGDTTRRRDASIAHLRYNRVAYMGNQFPVEATVRSHCLDGERVTLSVSHDGRRIFSKELRYAGNDFSATETFLLSADQVGLQHYTVNVTACRGEVSVSNNSQSFTVEVLEGHQRIAIVAAAPHPDVSALRKSIERNPNYEVSVHCVGDGVKDDTLKDCGLLIFHNLPSADGQFDVARFRQVPSLFVVGNGTDLQRFNELRAGLEISARTQETDEVTVLRNSSFALFSLPDDVLACLEQMPPLMVPFGIYHSSGGLQVLFNAKVGSVASDRPVIAFCQQEGVRRGFVVGEGLWRWRMQDYLMNGGHGNFDQLVEKMVVYASLRADRDRLQVSHEPIYQVGEKVELRAELYNDNFELVNTPDVLLSLYRLSEGGGKTESVSYEFARSGSGYVLRLGQLAPGRYGYAAKTVLADKEHLAKGAFVVEELNLEGIRLEADHVLLSTIADATGAQMLAPDSLDRLPELLRQRDDLKTVLHPHVSHTPLMDFPWLFVLFVVLLAVEWAVRKYLFN